MLVAKEFLNWFPSSESNPNKFWWNEEGGEVNLKFFSSDDEEAFQLLKMLRALGDFCCITITTDYHYRWSIKLIPDYEYDSTHTPILCFEGESFAEIVCNAVVEAARYVKENSKK